MIDLAIYALVGLLAVGVPAVYFLRYRRHMAQARRKQSAALASGMTEPVSLHPKIDPNLCICSGGCTAACPEGGIIGIVGGMAELVIPTKCIGHGACVDACPVGAISLVFGTERRGVDIPHVTPSFESNVTGVYIAGELGGMGLIRNAVTQGREAAEYIAKGLGSRARTNGSTDLVIVGAGPAGLSAALQARKDGLSAVVLEQGDGVGGAVLSFPRQKLVMTQPMVIPLYGEYKRREIQKEELLELWLGLAASHTLDVRSHEKVEAVTRDGDRFVVRSLKETYHARRVLLAIGRRGTPRRLDVPGENSPQVVYQLLEPEQYIDRKSLVVGGGDSAVEAAVTLSEQAGTTVALSYRKNAFSRVKEKNRDRLRHAVDSGAVTLYLESQVKQIEPGSVHLEHGGGDVVLDNDYVFVFAGGEMPTKFLSEVGIHMETKFGER